VQKYNIECGEACPLFQRPAVQWIIIGFLLITAFVIRLHHINRPLLDFQPIRQYMLAHHTRSYYYEGLESIPEWKKQMARINKERMGFQLEPRILEHIVVFGYRMLGGEYLWIPRVLSSVFWIIGGVFLYLIAKKILSPDAALFSIAYYLFLPFGISASRSFQPDPMMIMLLLFSIFMILRYYEQPSFLRLVPAIFVSSLPMLIKPYSIFLIFGAFISIAIYREGIRKLFTNRNFLMFIFLSPLPGAAYYLSGMLTPDAFLQEHAQATFLPHLLLRPYFWKDWLAMIARVVGLIAFTGALLGVFMVRRLPRFFLIGLWAGYFIYGLLFTFHIHTHDYYQLQFIPVVALSLGPVGALIFSSKKRIILAVLFLVSIFGTGLSLSYVQEKDYNRSYLKYLGYVVGINPQFYKFVIEDFEKELKIAEEIGEIVNHNTNTLFLTSDFGRSLTYHGELSGLPWPTSVSFQERRDRGIKSPPKEELFNRRYFTIRAHAKFIRYTPDFFIITDFEEFKRQPDLKKFLTANFPIIAQNDDYLIFDLRKMSDVRE
jgi:hypothetical protein